jgi:chromosome segregation protein
MRLKRVKIFGFKTFADRTEFDLHGNLIAVVGPNGCGKSNLVDAILWGLGEGNARHLRAQNSQDVIFSGSSRRKGVGFAEVTLLFDNEDGALPINSSEVSITRRLTRSGDSEYYINRQSCRLRDVFDLLADSGLGRAGYAIVGQKEIDQALAASADDRRAWVDEAAGVQRYRARKMESLKRLSSAHSHLERVHDILYEIEGQREPLREEAEVATRYKSLLESLRAVESGLLIVEVAKAKRDVDELEVRISESLRLARAESEAAEAADADAKGLTEKTRSVEAELDRLRDSRQVALTRCERSEAALKLGEQKLRTLADLEQNLGEEAEASKLRIKEAELELQSLASERDGEDKNLTRVREECSGAGEQARELTTALKQLEQRLSDARLLHNRRLRQDAEVAQLSERRKLVSRELEGVENSLPDLNSAVTSALGDEAEIRAKIDAAEKVVANLLQSVSELDKREFDAAQQHRKKLSERATLEGRRQGIEATIEAHEGLNQGAKAVLDAKDRGHLQAAYIPVGEALDVSKEHALAIETALGGAVNDLIVLHERDAKSAIEHLKQNRLGRATFQPIPLMKFSEPTTDLKRLLLHPGVLARASDLVRCAPEHRPVIESLLGRVVVVENLEVALKLAKGTGWNRLVTLEGEVVYSGGAVTGGQTAKQSYGLVQRKADLGAIIGELKSLEKEIASAEKLAGAAASERESIQSQIADAKTGVKELQEELKSTREWLHSVQSELTSTERSRQKLALELEQLSKQVFEEIPVMDLQALEEERDKLVGQLAARTADAESAAERLREAESRLRQAQSRYEIAERRLLAAREHDKLRERKLTNLGPERERTRLEMAASGKELEAATQARASAEREITGLQAQRSILLREIDAKGDESRKARSHAQTCSESAHQAELSRARIETKRTASVQRLLEEYGIAEEQALEQADGVTVPADAVSLVNRLRREIKAMGDVNVGAVEAYQRLTERFSELTHQREDILGGIKEVEASIRELDKLTRERFVNTFAEVQQAFSEIFSRLFGGGEGRIFLTDEDNVLESGVDIDVMLPGKKRQRLELLSGGERSLCAASFLFALLKVKPSPLVILDEVDAPLDGRNVERFIALLHDFTAISQFILITHNPTTIESAPVWLGVTMQEPGVSTLVPAKFTPTHAAVLN